MEILGYILYGIIGLCWGLIVAAWIEKRNLDKELDVDEVEQDPNILFLSAECLKNNIYLFDADTDNFICQGKDFDDLMQNFRINYPSKNGTIVSLKSDPDSVQVLQKFKEDAAYLY
jgi:hypothetical protein